MTILPNLLLGLPGSWEWILILVVVLIFFGRRIPGVARSLGSGITEFKAGLKEGESKRDSEKLPEGDREEQNGSGT